MSAKQFARLMPKAELHLHLEGSADVNLCEKMATGHGKAYDAPAMTQRMKSFGDLKEFIDCLDANMEVLRSIENYYDVAVAYLKECKSQNIIHVEFQFELQTPLSRGIDIAELVREVHRAGQESYKADGISVAIMITLVRHLSLETAREVVQKMVPVKDLVDGFGLAGDERANPIDAFVPIYQEAEKLLGKKKFVAVHAGEEGPPKNIWDAITVCDRVDHGVTASKDPELIKNLKESQIPLAICPTSNVCLKVHSHIKETPLVDFMRQGLSVSVNSDDPAYFGSLNDNFDQLVDTFDLSIEDLQLLASNSIKGSWASTERKAAMMAQLEKFSSSFEGATTTSP